LTNEYRALQPHKNGKFGFNLLVGGFFSPKRCAEAIPLDAWIPGDDVISVCKAVSEAYRDLDNRGNKQKTRMMWLIDELVSSLCLYIVGIEILDYLIVTFYVW
jgi:ferredoxin-nitrite reductase